SIGNDTFYVDDPADLVFDYMSEGTDVVFTTVSFALAASAEIESLAARDPASTAALNLTGNSFANTLTGDSGANVLNGGAGADALQGLLGNDTYVLGAEATGVDTVADSGGI